MRIVLLSINFSPEHTGIAPYASGLAEHLSLTNDVTVITGVPHYPSWRVEKVDSGWRRRDTTHNGVKVIRLRHFVPSRPTLVRRFLYELTWSARAARALRSQDADVILTIVPALLGAAAAVRSGRRRKIPVGVIVQDIFGSAAMQSGVPGGKRFARLVSRLERSILRRADSVATIHPRMSIEIGRLLDTGTLPSVIHNWTHIQTFSGDTATARGEYGWPADDFLVLHTGNMGSKQNLEVVIDAARLAQARHMRITFVLAGGGSEAAALKRYAAGCDHVRFLDGVPTEKYPELLAAADLLLVNERPGMRDMSLPSKTTSYLSSGRAIIAATDRGSGTAEFVARSGGGVVIDAGDPESLIGMVAALSSNAGLRNSLGASGKRFADSNLSSYASLSAYSSWVDELFCKSRIF